jgi:hypothetical protein
MTLLHHSTDTRTNETVTDVMASNAAVSSTREAALRGGDSDQEHLRSDDRGPGASVGLIIGALLALVLSAWAGIVAFVGPTFGFSADGSTSWTWNQVHVLGAFVPGAVGVLACAMILTSARRPVGHQSSFVLGTWGFALFLCGAWLTVTPVVWPVLVGTYFHAASPTMTLAYWMAYSSGPGVLLAGFGTFVMGRIRHRDASNRPAAAEWRD